MVQDELRERLWSADDFSQANKQVEHEKQNNWRRLITERAYAIPVDEPTIKQLQAEINKMDFEPYDVEMTF
jgi:hypothetical protein